MPEPTFADMLNGRLAQAIAEKEGDEAAWAFLAKIYGQSAVDEWRGNLPK